MAKTNTAAAGMPPQPSSNNVTTSQNTFGQNMPPSVNPPPPSLPPVVQAVSVPGPAGVLPFAGLSSAAPNYPANLSMGQSSMPSAPMMPQTQGPGPVTPDAFQQPLQILQALQAQGVPQDQWATVLSFLMSSGAVPAPNTNFPPQQPPTWQQNGAYNNAPREEPSRDRNGFNDPYMRSPPGRVRNRSRSRSPAGWDRRRDATPPRRRDSPVYGDYDGDGSGRNNNRGNYGRQNRGNGAGNDYRQRSPTQDRFHRSASPRRPDNGLPVPGPKWMEFDKTMAEGTIKGESRPMSR